MDYISSNVHRFFFFFKFISCTVLTSFSAPFLKTVQYTQRHIFYYTNTCSLQQQKFFKCISCMENDLITKLQCKYSNKYSLNLKGVKDIK